LRYQACFLQKKNTMNNDFRFKISLLRIIHG
jgi:hypothetical protein